MKDMWPLLLNNSNIFIFDSIVLICALYLAHQETVKYKKTDKEYHKFYSLFFMCAALVLMPFMISVLVRWKVTSLRSIAYDITSAVFVVAGLFYFFKGERLRKKSG
ncbi:MAG: hypothetical protein Q7S07_05005 [Candidatus Omnitrophota bacterium]|nr:hypothetical protein [Candidatus Omnitrophota bacterium]